LIQVRLSNSLNKHLGNQMDRRSINIEFLYLQFTEQCPNPLDHPDSGLLINTHAPPLWLPAIISSVTTNWAATGIIRPNLSPWLQFLWQSSCRY
jgi:hypothetical protein